MTGAPERSRVQPGVPAGGRFAAERRAEASVDLIGDVPSCELCPNVASTIVQAFTARGPVGQPRHACTEHDQAPTFTSFGGGWVERSAAGAVSSPGTST